MPHKKYQPVLDNWFSGRRSAAAKIAIDFTQEELLLLAALLIKHPSGCIDDLVTLSAMVADAQEEWVTEELEEQQRENIRDTGAARVDRLYKIDITKGHDPDAFARDLIADTCLWAESQGLDASAEVAAALRHYFAESERSEDYEVQSNKQL